MIGNLTRISNPISAASAAALGRRRPNHAQFFVSVDFLVAVFMVAACMLVPGAAQGKTAVVDLRGVLTERESPFPLLEDPSEVPLNQLRETLVKLRDDDEVQAVVFKLGTLEAGLAQVQEIQQLIRGLRSAEKRVVAHVEEAMPLDYMIAVEADEIVLVPTGSLFLYGVAAEVTYFGELMGLVGLDADIIRVGKFKTALEEVERTGMSEEQRTSINAILDDIYSWMIDTVSERRKIDKNRIKSLFDDGLFSAARAKEARLVDRLGYWEDELGSVEQRFGTAEMMFPITIEYQEPSFLSMMSALMEMSNTGGESAKQPSVAVVYAEGPITTGSVADDPFANQLVASDDYVALFNELSADDNIRAVVVRVDSPGGSALASDLIWKALFDLSQTKPVIASMGNIAASGGYYIATGADEIFAESLTLTGSIGVVGGKVVLQGLYDKAGISGELLTRGKHAAIFSGSRNFTDSERAKMLELMTETYHTFLDRVATGRKMNRRSLEPIAEGRVWSGVQARKLKLVDREGGLQDAVDHAVHLAGLSPGAPVIEYPRPSGILLALRRAFGIQNQLLAPLLRLSGRDDLLRIVTFFSHGGSDRVWALVPWQFRVR